MNTQPHKKLPIGHRLWLLFCQAVTIAVAAIFVVETFKPDWLSLPRTKTVVTATTPLAVGRAPPAASSYAPVAEKVVGAVVNIFTSQKSTGGALPADPIFRFFFGDQLPEQPSSSLGSGVIINVQGYIVTNHHVIQGADEIQVALHDGRRLRATLIGSDPESDLAVLRLEKFKGTLSTLPIAPVGSLHVGDIVLAVGNPFGVGQTVTFGIVSALNRSHLGLSTFENFIQTDAAINPGNSGGALVDAQGNLVGINTAIFSNGGGSNGIGFAIDATFAKSIIDQIVSSGKVVRGWIGVQTSDAVDNDSADEKSTHGSVITGVYRGGPADQAGVLPGDILTAINNKKVDNSSQMIETISSLIPSKKASLEVLRGNKVLQLEITVGTRPPQSTLQKIR